MPWRKACYISIFVGRPPAHRPCWHIWLTPAERSVLSARAMVANEQQQAQHACTRAIACEQLHHGFARSLAGQAATTADMMAGAPSSSETADIEPRAELALPWGAQLPRPLPLGWRALREEESDQKPTVIFQGSCAAGRQRVLRAVRPAAQGEWRQRRRQQEECARGAPDGL